VRFIECYVENFGTLHAYKKVFSEGLNSIIAENGYGKTTLSVFIKCMLYGMEDTKRTQLEENDRKHYMPWGGGRCGGTLSVEVFGVRYRIERSFGNRASEDTFSLYNLDTGEKSCDYSSNFGEEVLGIDRDGFERTIFLSERNLWGKNDNKSISAKLSDLVGCDGDIGAMDGALKRLEDGRKFYYKAGGRGEIGELRGRISECELQISQIERLRAQSLSAEDGLATLKGEISKLVEKRTALEANRAVLLEKKSRLALAEQYDGKMRSLMQDSLRLEELRLFFGGEPPSAEEIDEAAYKRLEAEKLNKNAHRYRENDEYDALSLRFEGKTDVSEVEKTYSAAKALPEKEAQLERLIEAMPKSSKYFLKRTPKKEELIALEKSLKKKNGALLISFAIAMIMLGTVLCLVFLPAALAAFAVGIILLVPGIIASKKSSAVTAEHFISELSDEPLPKRSELLSYLGFLIEELEAAEAVSNTASKAVFEKDKLESEISAEKAALAEFVARLGGEGDVYSAAEEIRESYLKYYKMAASAQKSALDRRDALKRAERLNFEADEFLSRYQTESGEPFSELKRKLTEYSYLEKSLAEKKLECAELKEKYGLGAGSTFRQEELYSLEQDLASTSTAISVKEREAAAIESRLKNDAERIEQGFELAEKKAELEEKLALCEHRLDVIVRTKRFLTDSKNSMTAKYLGKTRTAFDKYRSIIEGAESSEAREFMLDTSFSLTVTEGGKSHPHAAYSRGTRDLYALATRLALSDALYDRELPPLILDDPLANLDDGKLRLAKSVLREISKSRQIIYFTCQKNRNID